VYLTFSNGGDIVNRKCRKKLETSRGTAPFGGGRKFFWTERAREGERSSRKKGSRTVASYVAAMEKSRTAVFDTMKGEGGRQSCRVVIVPPIRVWRTAVGGEKYKYALVGKRKKRKTFLPNHPQGG